MRHPLSVLFFLAASACSQPTPVVRPGASETTAATATGAAQRHFGAAFSQGVSAASLDDIVVGAARFPGQVQVEGTVTAVCQNMGCWMEIRDRATQAHIRMHGHSFFIPRNASGRHAVVQATVVAAHPATECDHEAQAATGRVAQVELDATGVELD